MADGEGARQAAAHQAEERHQGDVAGGGEPAGLSPGVGGASSNGHATPTGPSTGADGCPPAVVGSGPKQSGIASGFQAPTTHMATTSNISPTVVVRTMLRKPRRRACCWSMS